MYVCMYVWNERASGALADGVVDEAAPCCRCGPVGRDGLLLLRALFLRPPGVDVGLRWLRHCHGGSASPTGGW